MKNFDVLAIIAIILTIISYFTTGFLGNFLLFFSATTITMAYLQRTNKLVLIGLIFVWGTVLFHIVG